MKMKMFMTPILKCGENKGDNNMKLPILKANKYKDPRFKANGRKFYVEEEKTDKIENVKDRQSK